ncbi:LysM peptidoglycan-binding domain-containing protein [Bifidobacterium pullorum subsp. saeculare]|uniref:LysM peptidoglycan-binding domain-containing protein n=2 Tax=Bifidobacterium pullorum TaxID=78448 RepID=A0A938WWL2_9BIFI|nr:LysM peptidoglycan-binding domain-containing protein [Bifidobacterium pullorum subsp. saeculare]
MRGRRTDGAGASRTAHGAAAGRALAMVMMAVCSGAMAGMLLPGHAPSIGAEAPVSVVTVRPGDTLWSYAADITPAGGDVGATVDELVELNGLEGPSLQVGQRLVVPGR